MFLNIRKFIFKQIGTSWLKILFFFPQISNFLFTNKQNWFAKGKLILSKFQSQIMLLIPHIAPHWYTCCRNWHGKLCRITDISQYFLCGNLVAQRWHKVLHTLKHYHMYSYLIPLLPGETDLLTQYSDHHPQSAIPYPVYFCNTFSETCSILAQFILGLVAWFQ